MKVLILSANRTMSPDPVFPLGASFIATACRKKGYEVSTYDCGFQQDIESTLKKRLGDFEPRVIGISIRNIDNVEYPNYTSYVPFYKELVSICRKFSKAIIVLGGSGFSLFPIELFELLHPDYGIVGEGEKSFIALIESIEKNEQLDKIVYSNRLNISDSPLIPDRSIFNFKGYYDLGGMLNIQTKRGCAFNCSYCTYPYLEGYKVRPKRPAVVVDEIEQIVDRYRVKHFFFVDNVFNYPESHAFDVCNEIIKRGVKIKWYAYIRPQGKDLNLINMLKEAGCRSIELGTDSMAMPTLESMSKQLKIDDIFTFCERCREVGINYCHSLLFGAPGETFETIKTTVTNVEATEPDAIIAFLGIRIYPNTPLAKYCVETGYIKNRDKIGLEPVFYMNREVEGGIIDYLKGVMKRDERWIIPGIEALDLEFFNLLRRKKKKGLMWEMKKYINYIK